MQDSRIILDRILQELTVSTNSFMLVDVMARSSDWNEASIRSCKGVHLNSIILALCKYLEFYKAYRDVIPEEHLDSHGEINSKLCSLNITMFRNKFIGHVLDGKTKEPLSDKEANDFYHRLTEGNVDQFISSINGHGSSDSMVQLLQVTKNAL